jgi:chaperonin GroEL
MKHIEYSKDAREKLLSGVDKIARAVKVTLGPSGRNVMIRNERDDRPFSTKDGVTVAGHMWSDDPIEMAAIEAMQNIANDSDNKAGDGTTTATVIGQAIMHAALKMPDHLNLIDVKRGMDEAARIIVEELKDRAINIQEDDEKLKQVAMISSNFDKEIADIVFRAFKAAGKQGVVNIKRSHTTDTYLKIIEGMNVPVGFRSVYYVNDHKENVVRMEKPYVFITNKKISKLTPNFKAMIMKILAEEEQPLLIMCPDIDPLISDKLIQNKIEAGANVCVVKTPGFGHESIDLIKDISTMLGKPAFLENEMDLEDIAEEEILNYIPRCEELVVGEHNTSFKKAYVEGDEDGSKTQAIRDGIDLRVEQLRDEVKETRTQYERSKLQTRISALSDGLAFINIGAHSEPEFREKQDRIQDALHAVKSAYEEGIIPGGGAALLSLSKFELGSRSDNDSTKFGAKIVMEAIREPFFQIIRNVGLEQIESSSVQICEDLFESGFDGREKEFVNNMIDAKIIDPVKVTRVALESAVSIAGLMVTTECVIIDDEPYKKPNLKMMQ